MLYRKAWQKLESWKAGGARRALMLTGARQVGKTTLVREFAKSRYASFAEVNFLEDDRAKAIFEGPLDADTIVENLTAYLRVPLAPGKTLVLLDEIQECPRARTAIKFLVEDGRFDYVETGSLLGVKTKEIPSYPVGFEETYRMFPMSFEEFCLAAGVQAEAIETLRGHFSSLTPVGESVHATFSRLFAAYVVVGGMPEVVSRFVETQDVARAIEVQRDILSLYRLDIAKYANSREKAKVRAIFDVIPSQLEDKNRRFVLADLAKTARQERYESSFLWLADAGIALPCYNATAPVPPLSANAKHSLFKLFLCDTGLLCAASLGNVQFDILNGDLGVNMGGIAENVVAQELRANGFDLFYLNSKRHGEVDFIVQSGRSVVPIEVKSGKDWTRHAALDNVMRVGEWGLEHAYVLCGGNVSQEGSIVYLPHYMAMFLQPNELPEAMPFAIDLSAL